MRKLILNRRDSSGHDDRSSGNPHVSDEQLLLALDGELSSREAALVKVHLEACWCCRTRSEQIGEAVADFVEYRNCLSKQYSPPSAGGRAMFVAQLGELARSAGRPTLGNRIAEGLRVLHLFSQYEVPRHVWISGIVIAALSFLLLIPLRERPRVSEVPRVSAKQFLESAQASEVRALQSVARPVIYQKVRIRAGSQDVTRTIYRDPIGKRRVDRLDINSSGRKDGSNGDSSDQGPSRSKTSRVEAELRQTFQEARLNWEDPLSPASYRAWHNSLSQKQDEVIQSSSEFITLKTTTVDGPIVEASITARTANFHSVAEQFRLRGMRLVEISELAWDIMPLEAINPTIFVVEPPPPPVVPRLALSLPTGPTDTELTESELQARLTLHAERADLGEEIELDRDTLNIAGYRPRALIVRGILATPERKAELSAALRGIPHLQLQLQTVEEAAALERQAAEYKSEGAATQRSMTSDFTGAQDSEQPGAQERSETQTISGDATLGKPLLSEQLEEHFPNAVERTAFGNRAIEIVQDSLAQAWALRRLRERYMPEEVARLSHGSRRTLELLIRDHVSALRRGVDEARQLLSPLLPPEAAEPVSPLANLDAPFFSGELAGGWRGAVAEIFPEVQKLHTSLAAVLAQPGPAVPDQQVRDRDLELALNRLDMLLPLLYQHVSGAFLERAK